MKKVVVDTDIILNHLTQPETAGGNSRGSVLRRAMSGFFCYTTVFNAIELFSLCESPKERLVVEDVMYSMKVLGLNGKSAKNVGEFMRRSRNSRTRDIEVLVAGVCLESRLPLLTASPGRYQGMRLLKIVTPDEIEFSRQKGT